MFSIRLLSCASAGVHRQGESLPKQSLGLDRAHFIKLGKQHKRSLQLAQDHAELDEMGSMFVFA
jgi:hypothetical protein